MERYGVLLRRKPQPAEAHAAVGPIGIIQRILPEIGRKIGAAVGRAVLCKSGVFHAVAAVFVQIVRAVRRGNARAVDIKFIGKCRLPILPCTVRDEAAGINAVLERIARRLFAVFQTDHLAGAARAGRFNQQQLHAARPVHGRQRIIAAFRGRAHLALVQPAKLPALVSQRILRHIGRRSHYVPCAHRHAAAVVPVLVGQTQCMQKAVGQHAPAALAALHLHAVLPRPINKRARGQRVIARNLYFAGQRFLPCIAPGKRIAAAAEGGALQHDRQIIQHAVAQVVQRVCIRA